MINVEENNMKDVEKRLKRKNKILFTRESVCLQDLLRSIEKQNHRTLVLWAFTCTKKPLTILKENYPQELQFQTTYDLCVAWSQGKIKMAKAKRSILDVHALAKTMKNPVDIALCHALGQGLATIHVETHAIGLALYELSAIVLANKDYELLVNERIEEYKLCLLNCAKQEKQNEYTWAPFLLEDRVNKEWLLHQKQIGK